MAGDSFLCPQLLLTLDEAHTPPLPSGLSPSARTAAQAEHRTTEGGWQHSDTLHLSPPRLGVSLEEHTEPSGWSAGGLSTTLSRRGKTEASS